MSFEWITTLTFVSVSLIVGVIVFETYVAVFRYSNLIRARLEVVRGHDAGGTSASLLRDALSKSEESAADVWVGLREYYEQACIGIRLEAYIQAAFVRSLGPAAAAVLVSQRPWSAPIGIAFGVLAAVAYVVVHHRRRRRNLMLQLPKALDVISRTVRAGQTLPAAFRIIADDFDAPISEEFRLCCEAQNLGIPYEVALRHLARRTGVMELRILVVALLVQTRSGGNIAELLDNLSSMVGKRLRVEERVRALTAEGRMQAGVLIALPTVVFLALSLISYDYVAELLAYPKVLAASVGCQVVGAIWIRRCIGFEY